MGLRHHGRVVVLVIREFRCNHFIKKTWKRCWICLLVSFGLSVASSSDCAEFSSFFFTGKSRMLHITRGEAQGRKKETSKIAEILTLENPGWLS